MEKKQIQKYIINGKEYNSLDEMPEDLRILFEDKNKDGIPDILEGIDKTKEVKASMIKEVQVTNKIPYQKVDPFHTPESTLGKLKSLIFILLIIGILVYYFVIR